MEKSRWFLCMHKKHISIGLGRMNNIFSERVHIKIYTNLTKKSNKEMK